MSHTPGSAAWPHDAVLAEGAIPLDVLETLIDDWIARRKASTGGRLP